MHRATEEQFDEASAWALEPRPGETLRACLERTLRDAIREGSLRAGVELPASRRLATQLGVSRGVASDAYAELERIASQSGVRVEALSRYAIVDRERRGLVIGYGRMHESAIAPAIAALRVAIGPALE
jgi:DNA-binding transcriptional MocR family regulator